MSKYNFDAIPSELKLLKQWCLWRYVDAGGPKPTKVPFSADGSKLSVTNPNDWLSFADTISIYSSGFYDGIGFIFSKNDPYCFIDLDKTDDKVNVERQLKVFKEFDSYSEKSPSGQGLHIIIKGALPNGRKRADIEIYSSERYATMTGLVYHNKPIEDRQELLQQLYQQMGGPPQTFAGANLNEPQREEDSEIIRQASNASNSDKFQQLFRGEWQSLYASQSEADFAIIDMFAFYTQNRNQIVRLFKASNLGKRDKANRNDYVQGMITRSFDRQLPKLDFDGYRIQLEGAVNGQIFENSNSNNNIHNNSTNNNDDDQLALPLNGASSNGKTTPFDGVNIGSSPVAPTSSINPPPGLVGEIAQFIYQAAPRPVPEIAIAAAIGLMAGICGRAYNVSGTGLNQYILCLAMTGAGKEAMASGIDKLINAVQLSVPVASEFIGPSEIASGQALVKYLANKSQSFVSILGEFGLRLRAISSERANGAEIALRRMLLDLYNKSGYGQVARPSIYADSEKNTNLISSPAFSILGESTPERFYDILNEEMISEGLLPRFMLIEYNGARPQLNEYASAAQPSMTLIDSIAQLMATAKTTMANRKVINVAFHPSADKMLKDFDRFADSKINSTDKEIIRQLWNRAHIKVLKISALLACGINMHMPTITEDQVIWAKQIVEHDIKSLSDKFVSGEIGKNSYEIKQLAEVKRILKEFVSMKPEKLKSYQISETLYYNKMIPIAFIQRRLMNMKVFKDDKIGAVNAINKMVRNLIDIDYIAEVQKSKSLELGTRQKLYMITNMAMFEED